MDATMATILLLAGLGVVAVCLAGYWHGRAAQLALQVRVWLTHQTFESGRMLATELCDVLHQTGQDSAQLPHEIHALIQAPRDKAAALADTVEQLRSRLKQLEEAIVSHRDQHGDDRCWMDDEALYEAAGVLKADRRVGSKEDMLKNCQRYIEARCEQGKWISYAELEKRYDVALKALTELERQYELLQRKQTSRQILGEDDETLGNGD